MSVSTRVFLVLLRLAIGWHFFFEGLEKIRSVDLVGPTDSNRPWTSRAYLRESNGPFADFFRRQAGDPDEEALAILQVQAAPPARGPGQAVARRRISPALDEAWNAYLLNFIAKYQLDERQTKDAQAKMDQAKEQAVLWLLGQGKEKEREVERSFGPSVTIHVRETAPERIAEYHTKLEELRSIMRQKLPAFGHDVEQQRLAALKGEVNRLRSGLLADLEKPMQESLETVLTPEQKREGAMALPPRPRVRDWTHLDWIDAVTRYGLTAVGACLLLGLFTRLACLGGAGFLLLFYLAMPALPWLPENPRAEGHYVFINKNIIEMLALLALATTRSGLWAGIDGLVRLVVRRRRAPVSPPPAGP
jgi:uncharacterized membrane protein YphA (DoxX/SURF4 family)